MGFLDDLTKGVSNLGNDILKSVDNGLGSNLSGRGSKNGILTRAGKEFNRSDVGRFVGRAGTDIGNIVKSPFIATSDLLRGDTEQAGRSLGKGLGAVARVGSAGVLYYAEDNKEQLRSNSKWTGGLTGNLAGTASASRSAIEGQNISKADLNDIGQLAVKGAVIGAGVYYSSEIGAGAKAGYNYLTGGAKTVTGALTGETAKSVVTIGALAGAARKGDAGAAAKALGIDTSGLPQIPKLDPNISDLYSDYLDGSKGAAAVGGPNSYSAPYSPQASVSTPGESVKEAGIGMPILIILGLGLLSLKMRKS